MYGEHVNQIKPGERQGPPTPEELRARDVHFRDRDGQWELAPGETPEHLALQESVEYADGVERQLEQMRQERLESER